MLHDIFRETFVGQDFLAEGLAEGLEKGRKEGREEGREEGIALARSAMLLNIVDKRFPRLRPLAEKQCETLINHPDFDQFLLALMAASDELQAYQLLFPPIEN